MRLCLEWLGYRIRVPYKIDFNSGQQFILRVLTKLLVLSESWKKYSLPWLVFFGYIYTMEKPMTCDCHFSGMISVTVLIPQVHFSRKRNQQRVGWYIPLPSLLILHIRILRFMPHLVSPFQPKIFTIKQTFCFCQLRGIEWVDGYWQTISIIFTYKLKYTQIASILWIQSTT